MKYKKATYFASSNAIACLEWKRQLYYTELFPQISFWMKACPPKSSAPRMDITEGTAKVFSRQPSLRSEFLDVPSQMRRSRNTDGSSKQIISAELLRSPSLLR